MKDRFAPLLILTLWCTCASAFGHPQASPPVTQAPTQGEEFRIEHVFPSFIVFRNQHLIAELRITPEQVARATPFIDGWLTDMATLYRSRAAISQAPREQATALMDALQAQLAARRIQLEQECRPLLALKQRRRLREVSIRLSGLQVFRDRSALEQLAISTQQLDAIKRVVAQLAGRAQELTMSHELGEISYEELLARRQVARVAALDSALELLTLQQRARLEELMGPAVNFSKEDLAMQVRPSRPAEGSPSGPGPSVKEAD